MGVYPEIRSTVSNRTEVNPITSFRRGFLDNQVTSGTIAFGVPTSTRPNSVTTDGVHDLERGKQVIIYPYGVGANDKDFRLGVQLWYGQFDQDVAYNRSATPAYVPVAAAVLDCVIGNSISPASGDGAPFTDNDIFCKSITAAASVTQSFVTRIGDVLTATDGNIPTFGGSTCTIDTTGAYMIQFFIDINGTATATPVTSANILFAVI